MILAMKLIDYMKEYNLKQKDIAEVIHLKPASVSHKITGKRKWSTKDAILIEKFTKGMVSRMDILYPD